MNKDKLKIKKLLKDFNVKTEQELLIKLSEDAQTLNCIRCGIEFKIKDVVFVGGDPICPECFKAELEDEENDDYEGYQAIYYE